MGFEPCNIVHRGGCFQPPTPPLMGASTCISMLIYVDVLFMLALTYREPSSSNGLGQPKDQQQDC